MPPEHNLIWHSPEEIVEIAFQRARVVMMNEAHSGLQRCIRTRQIGQQILPVAHQAGVWHLAMEALFLQFAEQANRTRLLMKGTLGYLSQLQMREFIRTALDLSWTLIPYECDNFEWLSGKHGIDFSNAEEKEKIRHWQQYQSEFTGPEFSNWREEQQALDSLPAGSRMLVWYGNNHHSKSAEDGWLPMGYQFQRHSGMDPFVVDQTLTVKFDPTDDFVETELIPPFSEEMAKHGGTPGFLVEEMPASFARFGFEGLEDDAILISTQNDLE
jgi:hypothetical protein